MNPGTLADGNPHRGALRTAVRSPPGAPPRIPSRPPPNRHRVRGGIQALQGELKEGVGLPCTRPGIQLHPSGVIIPVY